MEMCTAAVSWWLDYSALPHRELWARLEVHDSGKATVIDCDGKQYDFTSDGHARDWLLEDEYSMLENLDDVEFMHGRKPLPPA
jgi:hypothetical protein